jgi:nucleotide-binding universal stress UspA family protein
MYDDILIPTDGSAASETAVDQGIMVAEVHEATIHLLYVIDAGTEAAAAGSGAIIDELTETLKEEANDALYAAETRVEEADVGYERIILEGLPQDAIVEYSTEHGIDLVIMGTSDSSGVTEQLLGSTTERVIRSVDTSVLVARS